MTVQPTASSTSDTAPTPSGAAPPNPLASHPVFPSTTTSSTADQDASGRQPAAAAAASTELTGAKIRLKKALRHFADFPIKGIDFVDVMPLFMQVDVHGILLDALTMQVAEGFPGPAPDVVIGLDARGFLFGPGLALRLGVGFVPVRKKGKLPGPCVEAAYEKEYGTDWFQMQQDGIQPGQRVLIVDDIIATGEFPTGPDSLASIPAGRDPKPCDLPHHLQATNRSKTCGGQKALFFWLCCLPITIPHLR